MSQQECFRKLTEWGARAACKGGASRKGCIPRNLHHRMCKTWHTKSMRIRNYVLVIQLNTRKLAKDSSNYPHSAYTPSTSTIEPTKTSKTTTRTTSHQPPSKRPKQKRMSPIIDIPLPSPSPKRTLKYGRRTSYLSGTFFEHVNLQNHCVL